MRKNLSFSPDGGYEQEEEQHDVPVTNFSAIRRLKDTENDVEAIRNRIQMLKLTEEKHLKRLEEEQRRIQRLLRVKQDIKRERAERQRHTQNSCEHLEALKQQNQQSKRAALSKLASLRNEIQEMKVNQYHQMRQKSQHIDEKIRNLKKKYQNENILKRNNIVNYEEQQRQYTQEFQQERLSDIHVRIGNDTKTMLNKQNQKQVELRRLEKLEVELVERCSRSSQAFQKVRERRENLMFRQSMNKENSLPQLRPEPEM